MNSDQYYEAARAYMKTHGDTGFMLALVRHQLTATEFIEPSVRQFGAWLAYFRRKGLKQPEARMKVAKYYMVPAEWPHVYDPEETVQGDYEIGDHFQMRHAQSVKDRQHAEKEFASAHAAEQRKVFVQSIRQGAKRRWQPPNKYDVKPHGYWTQWSEDERRAHDDQLMAEWRVRGQQTEAQAAEAKYNPKDASELRTPARPMSPEFRKMMGLPPAPEGDEPLPV